MTDNKIYETGDFSFINDRWFRDMIEDGYQAVTATEGGWDFFKEWTPPADKGYMWSTHPKMTEITRNMKLYEDHSGSTLAMTMKSMQKIARLGWNGYVEEYLSTVKM